MSFFTAVQGFLVSRDNEHLRGRLEAVNAQLREIGDRLMRLGSKLVDTPENVCFDGQPVPTDFFVSSDYTFSPRDLDVERVSSLIAEKREICRTLTALNREAEALGACTLAPGSEPVSVDSSLEAILAATTTISTDPTTRDR
jgi:hypothetical protein